MAPIDCRGAILTYWPDSSKQQALTILYRESGGNSLAHNHNTNGSDDYGCMQLNTIHLGTNGWTQTAQAYNPVWNVKYALTLYEAQGWRPWSSAKGLYW